MRFPDAEFTSALRDEFSKHLDDIAGITAKQRNDILCSLAIANCDIMLREFRAKQAQREALK